MAYRSIPYPAEFRQQMIELVRAGRTPESLTQNEWRCFNALRDVG